MHGEEEVAVDEDVDRHRLQPWRAAVPRAAVLLQVAVEGKDDLLAGGEEPSRGSLAVLEIEQRPQRRGRDRQCLAEIRWREGLAAEVDPEEAAAGA